MKGGVKGDSRVATGGANSLVSIIVPVYNAGQRLVEALVSAQEQTHTNVEIICVNDGSTDDSLAVLRAFAAEDARFHVIDKPNAGYGAAMNDGLAAARGEWVAILEPDDWMALDMLERMLAFASSLPGSADVVKCPYWRVVSGARGQRRQPCTYKGLVHPSTALFGLDQAPELFARHPSIWSALYRRSYLEEQGIRFPEHPGSGWADNRFLAEALLKTARIAYLDEAFYYYRAGRVEDEQAYLRANPTLPFERWQEMADVIDQVGVTDEGVLRAHIRRGFTYLKQVQAACGLEDAAVCAAMQAMFERMPANLVLAEPAIRPALCALFIQRRGLLGVHPKRLAHLRYLVRFLLRAC